MKTKKKATRVPTHITKFDAPSFRGYRVQIQRDGHKYIQYVGAAKQPSTLPTKRMALAYGRATDLLADLALIISKPSHKHDGILTAKAHKTITRLGYNIITLS